MPVPERLKRSNTFKKLIRLRLFAIIAINFILIRLKLKIPISTIPSSSHKVEVRLETQFMHHPIWHSGTQHQVTLSHSFACDSLSYNVSGLQCNCTPVRDTLNITACETQTIFIHGKRFTVNKPSGLDTISPVDVSLCDTIRFISINF